VLSTCTFIVIQADSHEKLRYHLTIFCSTPYVLHLDSKVQHKVFLFTVFVQQSLQGFCNKRLLKYIDVEKALKAIKPDFQKKTK